MKTIRNLHNFIKELPDSIRSTLEKRAVVRAVASGESIYRQGDQATGMYQSLRFTPTARRMTLARVPLRHYRILEQLARVQDVSGIKGRFQRSHKVDFHF